MKPNSSVFASERDFLKELRSTDTSPGTKRSIRRGINRFIRRDARREISEGLDLYRFEELELELQLDGILFGDPTTFLVMDAMFDDSDPYSPFFDDTSPFDYGEDEEYFEDDYLGMDFHLSGII